MGRTFEHFHQPSDVPNPEGIRDPRQLFLNHGINAMQQLRSRAQTSIDRAQSLRAEFFLKSMIRDTQRPLTDVVEVLRRIAKERSISGEFRDILHRMISECVPDLPRLHIDLPTLLPTEGGDTVQHVAVDEDEGDAEPVRPAVFSLAGGGGLSSPDRGDIPGIPGEAPLFDLDSRSNLPNHSRIVGDGRVSEVFKNAEGDQRAQRAQLTRYAKESRDFARRYFDRALPLEVSIERVAENVQGTVATLLLEGEYLLEHFGFDVGLVRNTLDEDFFAAYFDGVTRAGEERVEFNDKLRLYIGLRGRLGYLLGREAQLIAAAEAEELTPEKILGVAKGATRDDIEGAYISRLRVLNPDVPEDAASFAMLHQARERALHEIELLMAPSVPASQGPAKQIVADWDDSGDTVVNFPIPVRPDIDSFPAVSSGDTALSRVPVTLSQTSNSQETTANSHPLSELGATLSVPQVPEDLSVEALTPLRDVRRYTLADLTDAPWMSSPSAWDDEGESAHVSLPKNFPSYVLGVPKDADRATIERAYSAATAMLDFDRREDRQAIANLQTARELMLYQLERPRKPTTMLVSRPEVPAVERKVSEGPVERVFRAPGRLLRALFAGSALAAGAGIAVHEFTQNEPDVPLVTDTGSDSGRGETADGMHPSAVENADSSGLIAEATEDTGSDESIPSAPETSLARKYLTPESLRREGDSVWNVVIDMLRDRGLSTSHPQVQYFTHQVLVDSGYDALTAKDLQVGDSVNFANVGRMMDRLTVDSEAAVVAKHVESPAISSTISDATESSPDTVSHVEATQKTGMALEEAVGPAYQDLPTAEHTMHVMRKGEYPYKLIHQMLRERGLNWTTERINFLTQLVVDQNTDLFRVMVSEGSMKKMSESWIPIGAKLDFSDAVAVLDDMQKAKAEGKKAKTVRELARARGYKYPITMQFPKE